MQNHDTNESVRASASQGRALLKRLQALECFDGIRDFSKKSIVIMENDLNDDIHLVVSGSVEVSNVSSNGKEIWFAELGPGNIFGEVSALTGNKRLSTVTALEPTRIAVMSRESFFDLLRAHPDIGIALLGAMAERVEATTRISVKMMSMTISQRIRSELLDMLNPSQAGEGKLTIKPVPNFSAMARRLNTDRENVSREISNLSQKGVLEKRKKELVILDKRYLERSLAV